MKNRSQFLGIGLMSISVLTVCVHFLGFLIPSFSWFFSLGNSSESLFFAQNLIGCFFFVILFFFGLLLSKKRIKLKLNPLTIQKWQRFKSIRRSYLSLIVLIIFFCLALFSQIISGKKALIVNYENDFYFPAFTRKIFEATFFGQSQQGETDYRLLKAEFANHEKNWVLMPIIPYGSIFDTDDKQVLNLQKSGGIYLHAKQKNRPYSGLAYFYYEGSASKLAKKARFRKGKIDGSVEYYDLEGEVYLREKWKAGKRIESNKFTQFSPTQTISPPKIILYPPLSPSMGTKHYLGTDSKGWDVSAQLFGGLQVLFKAIFIFLFITYSLGISLGCLMGYLGGKFDIICQRFIEILSNIPSLLVVIILSDRLGKDQINLGVILSILCLFSWIGISYYVRAATYKEKERDYVIAVRLLGASPFRVIFKHILPNVISTIVTVIPFSVAAIVTSLTALDFLGFGLPETYPSWGRLLGDGISHLESPWIVGSVFVAMTTLLLLVTFVGEGIRQAFDPKKFATYR